MSATKRVTWLGRFVTFHASLTNSFKGFVYDRGRRVYGTLEPSEYTLNEGYAYIFTSNREAARKASIAATESVNA
jgi:hypothetical protein